MIVAVIVLAAVLALVAIGVVVRRQRVARRARAEREAEIRAALRDDRPAAADPAEMTPRTVDPVTAHAAESGDPWADVEGVDGGADPAGPPAAIMMAVTGIHPWAPAAVFLTELKAEGYATTVELPDLVVVRDDDRLPVTVREPVGPAGSLIVTAPPDRLAKTLELLVRSLLASEFTIDATDGRDVRLTDGSGTEIRLTVSELART